jgi:hypothetical protein
MGRGGFEGIGTEGLIAEASIYECELSFHIAAWKAYDRVHQQHYGKAEERPTEGNSERSDQMSALRAKRELCLSYGIPLSDTIKSIFNSIPRRILKLFYNILISVINNHIRAVRFQELPTFGRCSRGHLEPGKLGKLDSKAANLFGIHVGRIV